MEINPYRTPDVDTHSPRTMSGGSSVRREGNVLVTPTSGMLPPRCVKCNEPMAPPYLRRRLSWHHPLIFLLLFCGFIIYVIVALGTRRRAVLDVGLCRRHWAIRRRDFTIAWGLALLSITGFGLGVVFVERAVLSQSLLLGASLTLVAACVWGFSRASIIRAKKINRQSAWVLGICPEFLNQLEEETLQ